MKASSACYDLAKRSEDEVGFLAGRCSTLKAYLCPSGRWTCGWGSTRGVTKDTVWTQEQADARLIEDMAAAERIVNARFVPSLKRPALTQGQFDALCDFVFNTGGAKFTEKSCTLLRWLNAGEPSEQVAEQFTRWVYGKNPKTGLMEPLPGLVKRRAAEKALFLSA
jgi:lysozyme